MLAVRSCVLGEGGGLVAVLVVCSCVLGKEAVGHCVGFLLVCARGRGSWSLCWLLARVCLWKRELVAVLAVCSCVLG